MAPRVHVVHTVLRQDRDHVDMLAHSHCRNHQKTSVFESTKPVQRRSELVTTATSSVKLTRLLALASPEFLSSSGEAGRPALTFLRGSFIYQLTLVT